MDKEIKILLRQETGEDGRTYFTSSYEAEDLKDLCLALLTDENMKQTALMAAAYIASQEHDPEETIELLRGIAYEIRHGADPVKEEDLQRTA